MKVLHVIPSISPALGGPTQVVLNLVRALRECNVETEIVTTNDDGPNLLDVPLNQRVEYEQVPVWFLPRFSPPLKEYIFSAALTRWLWQHIQDYDLLDNHYLFSYASTCAGAIARRQKVPYLVRTMGQLTPWALAQSRLKKQVYTLLIEQRNLNAAAAIHCTSAAEAEDVSNFGIKAPIITLPLGINQAVEWLDAPAMLRDRYQLPDQTPVVLFLSRLHYKKRPDLLLQALSQLALQNHNFHLILAGSGEPEYETYLSHLTASLGLASCTTFTGFVAGDDKELLLQGSDLFVLPSFSENFGIAVAEAMSRGLPVVVTPDVQIAAEIAAEPAGLIVKGELAALTDAIAQLLTSPNLRHQLGENGKRLASRRYSWPVIASHLKQVCHLIIDQQPLSAPLTFD